MSLFQFTPLPIDENGKPIQGTYRTISAGVTAGVTAGSPIQLTNVTTQCKRIDCVSADTNSGTVYVGGSNVLASTKTGVPLLSPGSSCSVFVTDLSNVYFDSTVTGDKISYVYYV